MLHIVNILIAILALSPASGDQKILDQGKALYTTSCVACHGPKGQGDGPAAAAMAQFKPRNFVKANFKYGGCPDELAKTIAKGIKGTPMPSWKHIGDEKIKAIAHFIYSLGKKPAKCKKSK